MVYKKLLNEYQFHEQMKKELEIHYRVARHPNIVQLYAYFHDENNVYSLLEFANDGNLYQRLKRLQYFSEEVTRRIIQQVVAALWYLQERHVIHRDIKPENILITDINTWHVKLCDFGWSTHSIDQNRLTFCGTPDYLAPEIVKHLPYDDKIDNWAVGILTYELLTGASPFNGAS